MKIFNDTIESFYRQQVLAKIITGNLKAINIKTPHFHMTLKIHKEDIPGRPVVSSIDHYFQPHAKTRQIS